jgi:AraC-like DNA-binding protein
MVRAMGRPRRELPQASSLPRVILLYAEARGIDALALARRVGLPEDAARRKELDVTPSALRQLFEEAAAALGEPYIALRVASELPVHDYGVAELLARSSPTVGEGASHLARYAPLVHPELSCTFVVTDRGADWRARSEKQPRGLGRHAHEYGLAYVLSVARVGSGQAILPLRVWFAHARPPDLGPIHRFFGTHDIGFGEEDSGFTLSRETASLAMQGKDARLLATAKGLADAALSARPPGQAVAVAEQVSRYVEGHLPGAADMAAVAHALHMSARTLQRRLEDEGTAFSQIVDGVRQEVARRSLRDQSLTLGEIGYRLGFADLATFSRAFKRWTGMPPGMWRDR